MVLKRRRRGPAWGSYRWTDTLRWQLTALCWTTVEFKRLSKHYARESHNNDQRSNKRHKFRETWSNQKKEKKKAGRERQSGEKRWGIGTKINTLLYAALRLRPVTAPDSLSKDFNRQQTNWASIQTRTDNMPALPVPVSIYLLHSPSLLTHTYTHTHFNLLALLLQI